MNYKINGVEYPVNIIRKNNKNTYLRMKNNTIEISTNYWTTKSQILNILKQNEISIQKMITKCQQKEEKQTKFFYLGNPYDIIIIPTNTVEITHHTIYTENIEQLERWYQRQLKKIMEEHYQIWYQKFEEKIPLYRLRFRKMKTRWGVCNRKSKTITLNTELLHYSIGAIDYVIIHELSHLIHFNHSASFWNLVSKYCPNYKQYRKELKE